MNASPSPRRVQYGAYGCRYSVLPSPHPSKKACKQAKASCVTSTQTHAHDMKPGTTMNCQLSPIPHLISDTLIRQLSFVFVVQGTGTGARRNRKPDLSGRSGFGKLRNRLL